MRMVSVCCISAAAGACISFAVGMSALSGRDISAAQTNAADPVRDSRIPDFGMDAVRSCLELRIAELEQRRGESGDSAGEEDHEDAALGYERKQEDKYRRWARFNLDAASRVHGKLSDLYEWSGDRIMQMTDFIDGWDFSDCYADGNDTSRRPDDPLNPFTMDQYSMWLGYYATWMRMQRGEVRLEDFDPELAAREDFAELRGDYEAQFSVEGSKGQTIVKTFAPYARKEMMRQVGDSLRLSADMRRRLDATMDSIYEATSTDGIVDPTPVVRIPKGFVLAMPKCMRDTATEVSVGKRIDSDVNTVLVGGDESYVIFKDY